MVEVIYNSAKILAFDNETHQLFLNGNEIEFPQFIREIDTVTNKPVAWKRYNILKISRTLGFLKPERI